MKPHEILHETVSYVAPSSKMLEAKSELSIEDKRRSEK